MDKANSEVLYIGEYPPPFGGVTVKNKLLKDAVFDNFSTNYINLYDYKANPLKLWELLLTVCKTRKNNATIFIGCGSNTRLKHLLFLIYFVGRKKLLNRCVIIMMGGTLQKYCDTSWILKTLLRCVRVIFTESKMINKEFKKLDINNTEYFPNCRLVKKEYMRHQRLYDEPLKLLFFSRISIEKGVLILFDMCEYLSKENIPFSLDFYGELDEKFKENFYEQLELHLQCKYKGIFDSTEKDVYDKINEYDILLLPTKWKAEGVPGILVESKIVGVPAIVSKHNYNEEVVINYKEGIVLDNVTGLSFAKEVSNLYHNKMLFDSLSEEAYKSSVRYNIDSYIGLIRRYIY